MTSSARILLPRGAAHQPPALLLLVSLTLLLGGALPEARASGLALVVAHGDAGGGESGQAPASSVVAGRELVGMLQEVGHAVLYLEGGDAAAPNILNNLESLLALRSKSTPSLVFAEFGAPDAAGDDEAAAALARTLRELVVEDEVPVLLISDWCDGGRGGAYVSTAQGDRRRVAGKLSLGAAACAPAGQRSPTWRALGSALGLSSAFLLADDRDAWLTFLVNTDSGARKLDLSAELSAQRMSRGWYPEHEGGGVLISPKRLRLMSEGVAATRPQREPLERSEFTPPADGGPCWGVVFAEAQVTKEGNVEDAEVLARVGSCGESLEQHAIDEFQRWRYAPARREGRAVSGEVTAAFRHVPPGMAPPLELLAP